MNNGIKNQDYYFILSKKQLKMNKKINPVILSKNDL